MSVHIGQLMAQPGAPDPAPVVSPPPDVPPWRRRLDDIVAAEQWVQTGRREDRATSRSRLRRWVPPADAPMAREWKHGLGISANGTDRGGILTRPRRDDTPVRLILALWGCGFGARVIGAILDVPKSVIGERLVEAQGKRRMTVEVEVSQLIDEAGIKTFAGKERRW